MMLSQLIIATSNQDKVTEFDIALAGFGFTLLSATDAGIKSFPEETGSTYEENALIKANHALSISGIASLADDSGLEVEALGGAPGLYSARFGNLSSDKARTQYLLEQLNAVPEGKRQAKFVCCLVLALADGSSKSFFGESHGHILFKSTGQDGFGYDPVFYSDALAKSFAEVTKAEKQQVSHRGNALKHLSAYLANAS